MADRKGRSIMNIVLNSYLGTMFYDSKNTSKNIHDGFFIYNMINNTIEKIGVGSIIQLVRDNARNNIVASRLLARRHPSIFWKFCGGTHYKSYAERNYNNQTNSECHCHG